MAVADIATQDYDRGDRGYPCWAQKAFADGTS